MPEQNMPDHPQFGFFLDADPGDKDTLDRYPTDEANPVRPVSLVYPTRDNDFEMGEIERLQAENDRLRSLLTRARRAWNKHLDHLFDNEMVLNTSLYGLREVFQEVENDQQLTRHPTAQLDAARQALAEVYQVLPVFLQERLEPLRAILEYVQ